MLCRYCVFYKLKVCGNPAFSDDDILTNIFPVIFFPVNKNFHLASFSFRLKTFYLPFSVCWSASKYIYILMFFNQEYVYFAFISESYLFKLHIEF